MIQSEEELKDTFEFWIIELKLASPISLHPEYGDVSPPVPERHVRHVLGAQASLVLQHHVPALRHEGNHKVFL